VGGSPLGAAFRQPIHSSTARARPWHRRRAALMAALMLAWASGGCSFSYQLGSLLEKGKDEPAGEVTGSMPAAAQPGDRNLDDADLAIARAAAAEVLSRGGKDTSIPWENPDTGARGTVTPIASAYNQDGLVCHNFLASYVRAGAESWLQGEACRLREGRWEVRSLKPWRRS
jgi:surface antigen